MIAIKRLSNYPIPNVVAPSVEKVFSHVLANQTTSSLRIAKNQSLCVFRAFLDICGQQLRYISLEKQLTKLLHPFFGFCHAELPYQTRSVNILLGHFKSFISQCYTEIGSSFPPLTMNADERLAAIDSYKALTIDTARLSYYEGWETASKDGKPIFWHLHGFYNAYGPVLTEKLWSHIKRQCNKERGTTAGRTSSTFTIILSHIVELCPTQAEFNLAGQSMHINDFIINLYCSRLLEVTSKGHCTKSFHETWTRSIKIIEHYIIKSGIWSEPAYELFNPPYSTSSTHAGTHERVNEKGNAFNDKLVTNIPLSYSDDVAMNALLDNIQSDIEHVVNVCQRLAKTTIHRARIRKALASKGTVKTFKKKGSFHPKKGDPDHVDMTLPENVCATWEYYGYDFPGRSIRDFLKAPLSNSKQFITNYGILGNDTLYPFLFLLVNEHPEITESWLLNFELFDKHGKQTGFRQSGNGWIASSIKPRRGTTKAHQTITLTDTTKSIFDDIIELTAKERKWLKEQGIDDWRYLILGKAKPFGAPYKLNRFYTINDNALKNGELIAALAVTTDPADSEKALAICKNLSLTTFRSSCGVRVYLKTRSVKAMSDALGHDRYNPKLLSHYLPEPILRFFQDRWIRLFQNAIIYEAMKDSDYLFEAVDFSAEELDEFLRNHQLKPLPEHIVTGQVSDLSESIASSDEDFSGNAVIPVSTPILRVLNGVIELVDSAKDHIINPIAAQWYETARFVADTIETNCSCPKITQAMDDAKANPLPLARLKGATYVTP